MKSLRWHFVCSALVAVALGCSPKGTESVTVQVSADHVTVTPSGPVTLKTGAKATFDVTAESGFTLSTTVGGTCPAGTWAGATYTSGAVSANCNVSFSATPATATHQVTVSGDGNESITPSGVQTVSHGSTRAFTVVASQGFTVSSTVGGTCPAGAWSETIYTTGSITADCTVSFSAVASTHVVTASGDGRETIQPSTAQTVAHGATQAFSVTANAGNTLLTRVVGTCPTGSWSAGVYTTGAIVADCTVTFAAIALEHVVTASGDGHETIQPSTTQTVVDGATQAFTVAANEGYTLSTTVGGTCPSGNWNAGVYTTGAIVADCTVTFSATLNTYTVTATGDSFETIEPGTQTVRHGNTQLFLVVAVEGHTLSTTVGGTCPAGNWNDDGLYLTGAITADCSVTFSAPLNTYTVTASGDSFETIEPGTAPVGHGSTQAFTVTASLGYTLLTNVAGSCPGGSWNGSVYTTGAITGDCTVTFSATLNRYSVTASGDSFETIEPTTTQTVNHGSTQAFTVAAIEGHTLSTTVGGTCPAGSWNGGVYTTGAIVADCTVAFSATLNTYTVTASGDSFESIDPSTAQTVGYRRTRAFTVTPNIGYTLATNVGGTCPAGGWNAGVYTTGEITADCTVAFGATLNHYAVIITGDGRESFSPTAIEPVEHGGTRAFTVTANPEYVLSSVGGSCPAGSWSGDVYTTGAIVADCSISFLGAPSPDTAAIIALLDGDHQSGATATVLGAPLRVLVINTHGETVPGVSIDWSVVAGDATLSSDESSWAPIMQTTTDAEGVASAFVLLGNTPESNSFTAKLSARPGMVLFSATTTLGPPSRITPQGGMGQVQEVTKELSSPLRLVVADRGGNVLSGVKIDWTAPENGSVSADETTWTSTAQTVTDSNGETSVFATLGTKAGSQSFVASINGDSTVSFTFIEIARPSDATSLAIVSGAQQSGTVWNPLVEPFTVVVTDDYGNAVPGIAVDWYGMSNNGVTDDDVTFWEAVQTHTNGEGLTSARGLLSRSAGGNSFIALLDSDSSVYVEFVATAQPDSPFGLLLWSGENQAAAVGSQLAEPVTVYVGDAYLNAIPGTTVTWTSITGGGLLSTDGVNWGSFAQSQVAADTELATIFVQVGPNAGTNTFEASLDSVPGSAITFTATAFDPAAVTVAVEAGDNQATVPGGTLPTALQVKVVDAANNPLSGMIIDWSATAGGGGLWDGSVKATAQSTTNTEGYAWIRATVGSTPGANTYVAAVNGAASATVTFHATTTEAPTAILVAAGDGQSGPITTVLPSPLTVLVTDGANNPIEGLQIDWQGSSISADGTNWGERAQSTTDANGKASILVQMARVIGPQTITATVDAAPNLSVNFTATTTPGSPAAAMGVSGVQRHLVGTVLPSPLRALAVDEYGNIVTDGVTLEFSVLDGDGSVSTDKATWTTTVQAVTDASGYASVWAKLGPEVGQWRYRVTIADNPNARGDTFFAYATDTVGPPTKVVVISGLDQTGNTGAGLSRPLVAAVTDDDLNPIGDQRVLLAVNSGGGLVSLDNSHYQGTIVTRTDASGYISFWGLLGAPGFNWFKVTLLPSFSASANFTFEAASNPATQLSAAGGDQQTAAAGANLATPLEVLILDAQNRPVAGATVDWTAATGGGAVSTDTGTWNASAQSVSDFRGHAWIYAATGNTPGANTFTAKLNGLPTLTVTFAETGVLGPASVVAVVSGDDQTFDPDAQLAAALVVRVEDAHGNLVPGALINWSSTEPDAQFSADGSSWSATLQTTTNANGQTSVRATAGASAATQEFKATVESGSASWTFKATAASHQVTASGDGFETIGPSGAQVVAYGDTQSFTVTNVPGYVVSLDVGGSCPAGSWAGLVYKTGAIRSDCSVEFGAFAQTFGAATTLSFTQQPTDTIAGNTMTTVKVAIVDGTGATVLNDYASTVTLSLTGHPDGLGGTVTRPVVRGVATFSDLSVTLAGSGYSLTASSTDLVDGESDDFAISPAAATGIGFITQPVNAEAGATLAAIKVAVKDAYGNIVTSDQSSEVTLLLGPEGSTFSSGTVTRTVVDGVATFDDLVVTRASDSYFLYATVSGRDDWTAYSDSFAVSPAAAEFSFTSIPIVAFQNEYFSVSVAVGDAYGNPFMGAMDVTLSVASFGDNPGGTLSGTLTLPLQYGTATFSDLTIDVGSVGYTLQVSGGGLTKTSGAFNVSTPVCPFITEETACHYSPWGCSWNGSSCGF